MINSVCEFTLHWTELSPFPPVNMKERAENMRLLLLMMMIYGLDGHNLNCESFNEQGNITILNDTRTLEITISLAYGRIFTVLDTGEQLTCNSLATDCAIECSSNDFFKDKNFTTPLTFQISAQDKNEKVDFCIQDCKEKCTMCTVLNCSPDKIVEFLNNKEQQMEIPKDLKNILYLRQMCKDVIYREGVVDTYIRVEKRAINNVTSMNITEKIKSYSNEDLSMTVVKMNLSMAGGYLPITAPNVVDTHGVAEIMMPLKSFQNNSENRVGIVTYYSDRHLKLKLGNKTLASKIIRIEYPGNDNKKLTDRLKILFEINYTNYISNYIMSCQFYDEEGSKTWKTDGCLTNKFNGNVVECSCDHMTPFAVLLTNLEISAKQWEILSYISYVGCGLSAFFSAIAVLMVVCNRNVRKEVSTKIHVSLSGALLLLNISFMLSEWAATLEMTGVCVFIAVMIHYSLLSCFTWMAIEALHLYLLLIRVFNIYIRHYMVKLSLVGWGVPAVAVGSLLSAYNTHQFYGVKEMGLSDTNATNSFCWIKDAEVLYGLNLFYFSIVFLFNLGILITVSRQIIKLRHVGNSHGKMPGWKDAGTVLGLMCLLGTTWGLIFFGAGYTNYPILYLFCILNTLQGFYVFMWICSSERKNRDQTHSKTKSTLDVSK